MQIEIFDEVVRTDYSQFDIVWGGFGFDGNFAAFFDGQVNGLVGAAKDDGVYLNLGRRSGGSQVRMLLLDAEPPMPSDSWEDVVEVSIAVPPGVAVRWVTWAGESHGPLDDLTSGSYRLRVSARGRDAGCDDEFSEEILDHYLLEFWPAPPEPDRILRIGSENAAYYHREVGSRR